MKLHFSFRKTSGLVISGALILIFALFCSARVGYFLLLALFLSPVFSVLLAQASGSKLIVKSEISHLLLSKGDTCTLTVKLENRGFLPCPPVKILIKENPNMICEVNSFDITALPGHTTAHSLVFTACLSGGSYTGIKDAVFSDWFNICSFSLIQKPQLFKTGVIPQLRHFEADVDLLECVSDAFSSDRHDETVDEVSFAFRGFAGYDYKPYEPGDPLKRINSKVSAKMGQLMVRLDEKQAASEIKVIINPHMENEDPPLSQDVLESALGICLSLVRLDFSVRISIPETEEASKEDFTWEEHPVFTEDDLPSLSEKLAFVTFSHSKNALISEALISKPDSSWIIISAGDCPCPENMNIYNCSTGEWRHV